MPGVSFVRVCSLAVIAFVLSAVNSFAAVTPAAPKITFTSPAHNGNVGESPLVLAGTTHDNVLVSNLAYRVGSSGAWSNAFTANGFTNWQAQINLTGGTNIISVYATNVAGQFSSNHITVVLLQTNILTVVKIGSGVVSPNDNGKGLDVGKNYTLHAMAEPGWRFTNWTVSNGTNTNTYTSAKLTFMMESNLVIEATFADIQKPILTLNPPDTIHTNNTLVGFSGHAHDNAGVAAVEFQVDSGPTNAAASSDGFTNWTAAFATAPGDHTVTVWAVDTSGNISTTKTLKVIDTSDGLAPQAISGFTLLTTSTSGVAITNVFCDGGYAMISYGMFVAGNYNYLLTGSNSAVISANGLAPLEGIGSNEVITLNFAGVTNGIYSLSNGDSGTFSLLVSTPTAPRNLISATIKAIDQGGGYLFTNYLTFGSSTRNDSQLNNAAGIYIYAPIAPSAGLLIQTLTQTGLTHTNYALLLFQNGPTGTNQYFSEESEVNSTNSDLGNFAISVANNKLALPESMVGLTAVVTSVSNNTHNAFAISLGDIGFGKFENKTNGVSGVGYYTYTPTSSNTATLALNFTVPTNDSSSIMLTFKRTNSATFTSATSHGTVTLHAASAHVPESLAGRTLHIPSGAETFGYGTASFAANHAPGTAFPIAEAGPNPYTYRQFGPQSAEVDLVSATGSTNAATVWQLWFTSATTGKVISGNHIGSFTLK